MSTRTMRCGAKFTKRYADKPGRMQTRGHARLTGRWRTPRTAGSAGLTAKQALPHSLPIPPPGKQARQGTACPAAAQNERPRTLFTKSGAFISLPRRPARNRQKAETVPALRFSPGQRPRRTFFDLLDNLVGRGVLQLHPRPLLRFIDRGQRLYADSRMRAKVRLPDHDNFAVRILDAFVFHVFNSLIPLPATKITTNSIRRRDCTSTKPVFGYTFLHASGFFFGADFDFS